MIHKEGFWLYCYISLEIKRGDRLVSKYTYDVYGNRESLKRSNDLEIRYTYDALDRLIKEGGLQGNKTCGCDKRVNLIGITDIRIDKYILNSYDDEIHKNKNCTTVD